MRIMAKLFVLLLLWHCLISGHYYHSVSARVTSTSPEEKEDTGVGGGDDNDEELTKTAIKTFETKTGMKVDCIDINKQPSLDHPLLKDHVIQMRPSNSIPKNLRSKPESFGTASPVTWSDIGLGYFCLKGTVPIVRTTKEDRIRAASLLKSFRSSTNKYYPNIDVVEPAGQHVAVRHSYNYTAPNTPNYFRGVQGIITVHNPVVQKDQISASVLWVEGGPKDTFSTIQAGWVNGSDHGDCFNLFCNGFIQVSNEIAIGDVITQVSEYDGEQFGFTGRLLQDKDTRNWWFSITVDNKTTDIGYLPRDLVPYLDPADYIAWGGLVKSNPPDAPSPQMGNGHFPDGNFYRSSAVYENVYFDLSYDLVEPQDRDFEERYDREHCYKTIYDDNTGDGYAFFYGGPGGDCY